MHNRRSFIYFFLYKTLPYLGFHSTEMISLHHLHAFGTIAAKREVRHSTNMSSRRYAGAGWSAAELEKILNIRLFGCNRDGIMLTAAGETMCLHARAIEAELLELRNEAMHIGPLDARAGRNMEVLFSHRCPRIVCMLADAHHMRTPRM